jgi:ribonuclease P protein component
VLDQDARFVQVVPRIVLKVIPMERLKRRTDFRAAAAGVRAPATAFVLQARKRAESGPVRVGFTVSKQVGNAVERNRVRRRLREVVRLAPDTGLCAGHDYVLIGRRAALKAPFAEMARDLDVALNRIHASERGARGGTGGAHERPLHEAGSPRPKPRRQPRNA